ncbi:LysM peptidoglycan-binding domain-containing protein [Pseudomonadota bacterium]|nr:LysM peptidoglycan-binding domain-containing protein [Pseudomonadota bacterium]
MTRRIYLSLLFLLFSSFSFAADVELNPDHPQQYTVVSGDTLWDIAGKFLKYPWHWPAIWQANTQIENPHLIYPGDLLTLVYHNGQPVLQLNRGSTAYKMSPEVRELILEKAIPTIPLDAIRAFLTRPQILEEDVLKTAPYIVASADERLISGAGDKVYARGLDADKKEKNFSIFSQGAVYTDTETKEVLGYEAIYKGYLQIAELGDPAVGELRQTMKEVLVGDRLLPVVKDDYEVTFFPRSPEQEIEGNIISVFDGVSQIGQYQIVVLDRGARNGLEKGHVLSIYQKGDTVIDPILSGREDETYFNTNNKGKDRGASVTLPDEYAGVAMIFKSFEKVSYAIVMKASKAIHLNDTVSSID